MLQMIQMGFNLLIIGDLNGLQIPRQVPHPSNNQPIDLSKPEDVIIYIVLPLFFVLLYYVGRKLENNKK